MQSDARHPHPLLNYAPPTPAPPEAPLLREGNLLLAREGTQLPRACILCGEPAIDRPLRLNFTWDSSFHRVHHQKTTLELRKSATVRAYLCASHHRRWLAGRLVGAAGMVVSTLVMVSGIALAAISENADVPRWTTLGVSLLIAGFAAMILFLFVFALRTRTLSCVRIEGGYLYLEGACESFLAGISPISP
jgi:hypothetical protein